MNIPRFGSDSGGFTEVFCEVYDHLKAIARRAHRGEATGPTLQTTVLVHEAYTKLVRCAEVKGITSGRLLALMPSVVRSVLVDHARAARADKRGGGAVVLSLDRIAEEPISPCGPGVDVLALDESVTRLAELSPTQARIVEMRCFGGMTCAEVACLLGLHERTVIRRWRWAKAWLCRELEDRGVGGAVEHE